MPTEVWNIEDGYFALVVVNPLAEGYSQSWQSPTGDSLDEVAWSDYVSSGEGFRCQVTSGRLTPKSSNRTKTRKATFCSPPLETPLPQETAYTLDVEWYQDVHRPAGLSKFLAEHDAKEAYFYLGLNGASTPPRAIGRVRLQDGAFGGKPGEDLEATMSLGLTRKPEREFGDASSSVVV